MDYLNLIWVLYQLNFNPLKYNQLYFFQNFFQFYFENLYYQYYPKLMFINYFRMIILFYL